MVYRGGVPGVPYPVLPCPGYPARVHPPKWSFWASRASQRWSKVVILGFLGFPSGPKVVILGFPGFPGGPKVVILGFLGFPEVSESGHSGLPWATRARYYPALYPACTTRALYYPAQTAPGVPRVVYSGGVHRQGGPGPGSEPVPAPKPGLPGRLIYQASRLPRRLPGLPRGGFKGFLSSGKPGKPGKPRIAPQV